MLDPASPRRCRIRSGFTQGFLCQPLFITPQEKRTGNQARRHGKSKPDTGGP